MQDFITNVHGRTSQQIRAEQITKKIRHLNLISLVISGFVLVGFILAYSFARLAYSMEIVDAGVIFVFYFIFQTAGAIACVVLSIINLNRIVRYHLKPAKPIILGLLGIILSFLPYIYLYSVIAADITALITS